MSGLLVDVCSSFGRTFLGLQAAEDIMSIKPHLPLDHPFGPKDVAALSSALEDTLRSLRLIDRIDPAVSMIAECLIQLRKKWRTGLRPLARRNVEIALPVVSCTSHI